MARQSRSRKVSEPSQPKQKRSPRKSAAKSLSASKKRTGHSVKSKKRAAKHVAAAPAEKKNPTLISRTVEKISSTVRRALGKVKEEAASPVEAKKKSPRTKRTDVAVHADTAVRHRRVVKSDRLEDIGETIPSQQSFRETFDERHTRGNDENTLSAADYSPARFSDEDRFTNRSKDPRIGTRGRRYHP